MATATAQAIVEELAAVAGKRQLRQYANDTTGNASLAQHRSLVQTRLGADRVTEPAWESAMETIRETYR